MQSEKTERIKKCWHHKSLSGGWGIFKVGKSSGFDSAQDLWRIASRSPHCRKSCVLAWCSLLAHGLATRRSLKLPASDGKGPFSAAVNWLQLFSTICACVDA